MSKPDVLIVGAGLAGLCCARKLHQEGVSFQLIEASDGVGGRVRTDEVDGFRLDRGFQVLLTAYPEAQEQLDYDALNLCGFIPGALVRMHGQFQRITDPYRGEGGMLRNLFSPVGGILDKLRLSRLRADLLGRSIEDIFHKPETSTNQALEHRRFSRAMMDEFFRPLFGGIQLDPKLAASSRMFEFVFRMMAEGDTAVPERGMGEIPKQLASTLPEGSIRLGVRGQSAGPKRLTLDTGEELQAEAVVVATEGPESSRLLASRRIIPSRGVCCLYFAAPEPPVEEPILVLGTSPRGLINNLAVMSMVAPGYAPEGQHLISISVIGSPSRDDAWLESNVRVQAERWFGPAAREWRLLRVYRIEHAHPVVVPLTWQQPPRLEPGLYLCGDHRATPSIQGAMESGRLAAESLLRELRGEPEPEQPRHKTVSARPRRRLKRSFKDEEEELED